MRVIITSASITLDYNLQIKAATNIDIRKVKIRKKGRACLLKKSLQQIIIMETVMRLTSMVTKTARLAKIDLNVGSL